MMLPLITEYDIEKNLIYAEVNELGTYCVMDLEIWFDLFGIDPTTDLSEESPNEEISILNTLSSSTTATSESGKNGTPVLMFILLQGAGNDPVLYNNELAVIEDFCSNVLSRYPNTTIGLIRSYYSRGPELAPGVFNPASGATMQILDSSSLNSESRIHLSSSTYYTFEEDELAKTSSIYSLLSSWLNGDFADNFEYKFVYDFQNGNVQVASDENGFNICTEYSCVYSHISSDEYTYTSDIENYSEKLHDAILASDGLDLTYDSNTLSELIRHFDSFFPTVGYDAILSNNYKTVKLLTELNPKNGTDTDKDKLTDWDEMNQAYITVNSDGSVTLPQVQELIQKGEVDETELLLNLPPASNLEKQKMLERIRIVRVLPCASDPTEKDTDGDGLYDSDDVKPMSKFDERFMIVDTINYRPSIDFVDERYDNSQKCFHKFIGTEGFSFLGFAAAFASMKESVLSEFIASKANHRLEMNFGSHPERQNNDASMIHAADALCHYFGLSGEPVEYHDEDICEMISCSQSNLDHLHRNLTRAMNCSENMLKDNKSIIIASTSDSGFKSTCIVDRGNNTGGLPCDVTDDIGSVNMHELPVLDNYVHRDWLNAVGEAGASVVAEIHRSGDIYTMNYRYYMIDIYEWAFHYDKVVLSGILHSFHELGKAQEYLIGGYFSGTITWSKGDTAYSIDVLNQIKSTMRNWEGEVSWEQSNEYDRFITKLEMINN